jgi:hypothetical protein
VCTHLLTLCPCCRLLKAGGVLVNITYGEPAVRVPLLQRQGFEVCFYSLTKSQQVAAGAAVSGAPVAGKAGLHIQGPLEAHLQVRNTSTTHQLESGCHTIQLIGVHGSSIRLGRSAAMAGCF